MSESLRVGVMGAGAIGCYLGGKLAAAGVDVAFVGRGSTKKEVEEHGLTVTDLRGDVSTVPAHRVAIDGAVASLADRDVVLCCVKSAHTSGVAKDLAGALRQGAIVVSMQNGVSNADALREHISSQAVLGGVVSFNVVSKGTGRFQQATSGPVVIEWSADTRIKTLAARLAAAGVEVELARDIRRIQWAKLVMNLNNALSALSGAPTKDLLFLDGYRRIIGALIKESLDVMAKAGVEPGRLGAIPVKWFPAMLWLPSAALRVVARAQLKIDPEARSSMWEDLERGRLTEVDYLNGEVVRLAASCGASAPLNRRVVELVHEVEKEGKGSPKLSPADLWAALNSRVESPPSPRPAGA